MFKFHVTFLVVLIILISTHGANILAYIPTPALSHQSPFQPLWRELSLRGHNVMVLTTHPIRDRSLTNLTEIDLSFSIEIFKKWRIFERLIEGMGLDETMNVVKAMMIDTTTNQFQHDEVQKLLLGNRQFDVILAEPHFPTILGFVWKFKCPWIGISSLDAPLQYHYVMGNQIHPAFNPDYNLQVKNYEGLSFFERFLSMMYNYVYLNIHLDSYLDELSVSERKYFGDDMPHLQDVQNNVSMFFITTHPVTHDIRALQPNTIQIGSGMHIKEPQNLPQVHNCCTVFKILYKLFE